MTSPSSARPIPVAARFALVFLSALLAVGCASKPPYKQVAGRDPKLATPPHNLSAYDYPFDDDGTYRKDWVTNKNAKRPRRRTTTTAPIVAANTPPPSRPTQAPTPPTSYPPAPRSVTPPPSRPAPAPAAAPKPQARYHTVAKGDTLYSLSRRYGASVGKIKATNGLTSDTIRIGQTLRLP